MEVQAIAYSYWRGIKRGIRSFATVHHTVKDDVRTLARDDVKNGTITPEDYKQYIGEEYTAE